MPPKSSSVLSTITNHLKPHKAEAIQRIRSNVLGLVAALTISYLLPVPSLLSASRTIFKSSEHQAWSAEWLEQWFGYAGLWHLAYARRYDSYRISVSVGDSPGI